MQNIQKLDFCGGSLDVERNTLQVYFGLSVTMGVTQSCYPYLYTICHKTHDVLTFSELYAVLHNVLQTG